MKMTTRFSTLILCCLLTVCESGTPRVVGTVGQNITLTCRYDVIKHGRMPACWSQGTLPWSGCAKEIISTDGSRVMVKNQRYRMLGRLEAGNVPLTILNVKKEDAGVYGCRVKVSGIFNDEKNHIKLIIKDAPQTSTLKTDLLTDGVAVGSTAAQTTSLEGLQTSSSIKIIIQNERRNGPRSMLLMGVFFGLTLFVAIAGVVAIVGRRRRRLTKIHQQPAFVPSVRFSSSSLPPNLQHRAAAVENVYQTEGDDYYENLP
ncbi:hepatitis A virus cellular receptor 1 [Syngnathoides biaculeatus]|uniref:hepatitis A virus cellular receptor 1 n=1 Tax=Syngnathoides biaculeatus TaxID=300417 RepID=UPI002ADD5AD4|nr:hepatitis A virus cellular receptor 1 [Syngnathoides biaculeatus]